MQSSKEIVKNLGKNLSQASTASACKVIERAPCKAPVLIYFQQDTKE